MRQGPLGLVSAPCHQKCVMALAGVLILVLGSILLRLQCSPGLELGWAPHLRDQLSWMGVCCRPRFHDLRPGAGGGVTRRKAETPLYPAMSLFDPGGLLHPLTPAPTFPLLDFF